MAIGEATASGDIAGVGSQGDEPNSPTDLLHVEQGFDREKLHPYFRVLLESPAREPARAVVREIGPWLALTDPHFVKEFQEGQFDQRIWELYLWAALRELGFDVEHYEAPDFRCRTPWADFTLEATTAAPSTMGPLAAHPDPKTQAEMEDFLNNYMPLKYGSALMTKLNKKNKDDLHYWQREHAAGKPFIFAIADFHRPATNNETGSMTHTQSALWQYLYGRRVSWDYTDGNLVLTSSKVAMHKYAEKVAPSGFFDQELARNVSAVLFSNAGTLAKFDRMGVAAGYPARDHKYYRVGLRLNPDPNATMGIPFYMEVQSEGYEENWYEELQLFHNPNAYFPIPRDWFRGVTQHFFENENLYSIGPVEQVLSSYTLLMHLNHDQRNLSEGS
jgi:hypothetical protein